MSISRASPTFWRMLALPPDFVNSRLERIRFMRIERAQMLQHTKFRDIQICDECVGLVDEHLRRPFEHDMMVPCLAVGQNQMSILSSLRHSIRRNDIDAADAKIALEGRSFSYCFHVLVSFSLSKSVDMSKVQAFPSSAVLIVGGTGIAKDRPVPH